MTQPPPGYHYRRATIAKNPTRRRKATNVGGGAVAAIGVAVLAFMLTGGTSDSGGNAGTAQPDAARQPAQQPAEEAAAPVDGSAGEPAAGLPAANAPAPAASPTVAYARQATLTLRSTPAMNAAAVVAVPYDTPVTLVCHTTGPAMRSFTGRTTTVWDKVTTADGKTGYVSDGWVLTSDRVDRLVSAC